MNTTQIICFFLDMNLEKTKETTVTNILTCILNSIFSLVTCVGNSVILYAIRKTEDLHLPSFALLCCLATADLLVGLICQPFFVAYKIAELVENFSAYCTLRMFQSISSWITSGVSLLTLAAVSIDRLFALTLHLRYNMIVGCSSSISNRIFSLDFFHNNCYVKVLVEHRMDILPVVVLLVTFFVTTLSTSKIFQIVRRHQRQINDQNIAGNVETNTRNVLKCRKSAVTVLYVYGLFLLFYAPFCVTMVVETFNGYSRKVKIAYDYVTTAVFINSFLNPLVYCWRIRGIQRAVKNALRMQRRRQVTAQNSIPLETRREPRE